jgi:hypothetical protein
MHLCHAELVTDDPRSVYTHETPCHYKKRFFFFLIGILMWLKNKNNFDHFMLFINVCFENKKNKTEKKNCLTKKATSMHFS